MKGTRVTDGFLKKKKNIFSGQIGQVKRLFWVRKWQILIILDFKFCAMKGAKRYMKIILMVSLKKVLFRANGLFWAEQMGHFGPKNDASL